MMRILVVEDDKTSRIVLRRILEGIGDVEIHEAEDGLKAWEMLSGGLLPELCFLDINMPRLNGLDLLKRIRNDKRFSSIKVCFCSAVRDRQLIMQAATMQPDQYILKPYSRTAIQAQVMKVRGTLGQHQSLEPVDETCSRLGVDKDTYLSMLNSLMHDVGELMTRIPSLLIHHDVAGALMALDEAKSAAQNLGASRIFQLADMLVKTLQSGGGLVFQRDSWDHAQGQDLGQPWVARSTDQLMHMLRELHGELDAIQQKANQITLVHQEAKSRDSQARQHQELEMDLLTRFLTDVFQRGKLLGTTKTIRSKSLAVPIKASLLGRNAAQNLGVLTRKTSFSLTILDPDTASAIENCRRINDVVKVLSFSLDGGTRWLPNAAIRLLEQEIAARNQQGVMLLQQAIGSDFSTFLHRQEDIIRQNINQICQDTTEAIDQRVHEILEDIRERFQPALEGQLTAQPSFTTLDLGSLVESTDDAKWAAPYALLHQAAMLFRNAVTDPAFDRTFKFSTFDRQAYLEAMNLFGDPMAYHPQPELAAQQKTQLEAIAAQQTSLREKCRLIWRLIRPDSTPPPSGACPPSP